MTDEEAQLLGVELDACEHDPLRFVEKMFPWGKDELEGQNLEDWQREFLDSLGKKLRSGRVKEDKVWKYISGAIRRAIASGHGIGKGQRLDMVFDTPAGVRTWGDIRPGDSVFGADGGPTHVTSVMPYKMLASYRVTFDDRSFCDVSGPHLWNVRGRQERRKNISGWRTLETVEILSLGVKRPNGAAEARQWEIPIQGSVEFEEREVDIHPYLLGVWLGDGHKRQPRYTKPHEEVAEKVRSFGYNVVSGSCGKLQKIRNVAHLFKGGVFDKGSHERFIPDEYKYNTVANRMALFQGLCDTDGEVHSSGSIGYSTTSKKLADDMLWLARSLGCKAMLQPTTRSGWYPDEDGNRVKCRDCYRVTINSPFNPFTIKHRKESYKPSEARYLNRWIESIEALPAADGMCITVAAEDGLYLANDFIVTHNSALVSWLMLWALATKEDTKGVTTANTAGQLAAKTWAELGKWHRLFIGSQLFTYTATAIYSSDTQHEKTWRIDAIPWTEHKSEAFAGLHNKGKRIIVMFDEASAISDKIWEVTEGALTDDNTEIMWFAFGNPTRNTGRFYDAFHRHRQLWDGRQVDSRKVNITNKRQIEEWITSYGEDSDFVRIRVRGVFPRMGDRQFFSVDLLEQARIRGLSMPPNTGVYLPSVISLDSAWTGGDELACGHRLGLFVRIVWVQSKNDDDVLLANRLAQTEDEMRADAVFIDFGYGTGVYSVGKHMNRKWQLIQFGGLALDPKRHKNKRAEMYDNFRTFLKEGGAIADDPRFISELAALEEVYRDDGIIQLESKDDFIARVGYSPGRADAGALLFAAKVRPKASADMLHLEAKAGLSNHLSRPETYRNSKLEFADEESRRRYEES